MDPTTEELKRALVSTTIALHKALAIIQASGIKSLPDDALQAIDKSSGAPRPAATIKAAAPVPDPADEHLRRATSDTTLEDVAESQGTTPAASAPTAALAQEASISEAAKNALFRWRTEVRQLPVEPLGVLEDRVPILIMDIIYICAAFAMPILAVASLHFRSTFTESATNRTLVYVADVVLQLWTAAWIAMQFFVQRKDGWTMMATLSQIRAHYKSTRFVFDLLYAVPIEWIFIGWQYQAFSWLSLRHVLRLFRMFDMTWSSNPLLGRRTLMQFGVIISMSAFICSALAAAFWALEMQFDFVDSLYWLFATVVTVGYGDIKASYRDTKIYSIFVMLVGLTLVSLVTAWATKLMTESDRMSDAMNDNKEVLHSMLEHYEVPWDLRREVINLVPTLLENKSADDFHETLELLPPFVAGKMQVYTTAKFIKAVPIFAEITDREVILDMARKLTRRFVPPGEVVLAIGDLGTEVFFLQRGMVQAMRHKFVDQSGQVVAAESPNVAEVQQEVIDNLINGSFFGEEAMRTPPIPAATTYLTLQLVELLVLTRSGFDELCVRHPEMDAVFQKLFVPSSWGNPLALVMQ